MHGVHGARVRARVRARRATVSPHGPHPLEAPPAVGPEDVDGGDASRGGCDADPRAEQLAALCVALVTPGGVQVDRCATAKQVDLCLLKVDALEAEPGEAAAVPR